MGAERLPRVTVAIPVFNGERYLAEAIDSVLGQSMGDFELIICDDASTDQSRRIAGSRADPRIRLLRNEVNLGFGGNWNRCLAEARGHYIKILPQDDLLHPECLKKQTAALDGDRRDAIALVYCDRDIIGPSGRRLMRRRPRPGSIVSSAAEMARLAARCGTNPIGEPGAVLFRQAAARAAGAFNGERPFVIDIDYWLRLLAFGSALYQPEALASFRVSRSSHSVTIAGRQARAYREFLRGLAASGRYGLSPLDMARGQFSAHTNALGRALFYRLAVKEQR